MKIIKFLKNHLFLIVVLRFLFSPTINFHVNLMLIDQIHVNTGV